MSYRTEVNGIQVFGNDEYYPEWIEFIKSQGISVNEEGRYEGHITDFMSAIKACEQIVLRLDDEIKERFAHLEHTINTADPEAQAWLAKHNKSLFDLTPIRRKTDEDADKTLGTRLFDELYDLVEYGYLLIPIKLFNACRDDIELDLGNKTRFRAYRLKEGRQINVHAG